MKNKKLIIIAVGVLVAIIAGLSVFLAKPSESNVTTSEIYASLLENELSSEQAMVDMNADALALYGLEASQVSDYSLYITQMMPGMDEIFIAKATDGNIEDVMTALNNRVDVLYNEKAFYPTDKEIVDTVQVVQNGNYAMLYLSGNPDNAQKAVTVFKDLTN